MKGVTILNAKETYGIDSRWFLIPLILLVIGLCFTIEDDIFGCELELVSVTLFVLILSIVSTIILFIADWTTPTGKYQYEVTIDDNISMKEFNEHYEIIEQRGEIYVINEK